MSFAALCQLLEARMGLDHQSLGELALRQAFEEARIRSGHANLASYFEWVKEGGEGLAKLIEAVSIPESWFFRDSAQLDSFVRFALQRKAQQENPPPLNILCLPCARGEEPYSLAISLFEAGFEAREFNICAIDLNQSFIEHARLGRFASWSSRGRSVPAAYAQMTPQGLQISEDVCASVRFRVGNALDSNLLNGEAKFDVVFCRNLLIYLTSSAKKQLLQSLQLKMAEGGLFVSGHAENIASFDANFQQAPMLASHCFIRRSGAHRNEIVDISRARTFTASSVAPPSRSLPAKTADLIARERINASAVPVNSDRGGEAAHGLQHVLLSEVESLADRGQLRDARMRLDAFLASCGTDIPAQAAYLEAVLAMAHSDIRAAIAALKQALYLDREHADALSLYATLMQSQGDFESARRLRERLQRVWQGPTQGGQHGGQ